MTSKQVRVKVTIENLVQDCAISLQHKTRYSYLPDKDVVDKQHRDLKHISITLLNLLNYINKESEVEQRQDSQFEVSRVFAVSS